jgi:hypothetical protein
VQPQKGPHEDCPDCRAGFYHYQVDLTVIRLCAGAGAFAFALDVYADYISDVTEHICKLFITFDRDEIVDGLLVRPHITSHYITSTSIT